MGRSSALLLSCVLVCAQGIVDDVEAISALSITELERLDAEGFNALHRASTAGALDVVTAILGRDGANVNILSQDSQHGIQHGLTALALAANKGHERVVSALLLAHGSAADGGRAADVNLGSPLVLAAAEGHVGIIDALLVAGADVNLPSLDMTGATPLIAAAQMGQAAAVELLLTQAGLARTRALALALALALAARALALAHTRCQPRRRVPTRRCRMRMG